MSKTTLGRAAGKAPTGRHSAPRCGFSSGTPVLTLDGILPVEFLTPGDRIITREGARTLRAVHVQTLHNTSMARISEDTLGQGRPETDMLVAAGQPILIRDWRAKALYGSAQAMVPASRLADGDYIRLETVAEQRLFTLEFDTDAVIYAGGLELACQTARVEA